MARILIATVPVIGHVAPFLPLVRALVARGHEVRWYTGKKYRSRVEGTGAGFFPYVEARDTDDLKLDEEFPERGRHRGMAQLRFDMKHIFIDSAPGQLADLQRIFGSYAADVVLADPGMIGALLQSEHGGPPTGVLGVLPMMFTSVDAAPFGLGLAPMPGPLGRARNRVLTWLVQNVLFRSVQTHWNAMRARVGLPPTGWWLDNVERAAFYLQPSVPSFEYPRPELPSTVRFIGMMPVEVGSGHRAPPFWDELTTTDRPIVHVTQGTIANVAPELIAPALQGLANEDVLVVVSTGNRPVESLNLGKLPANARIATFLSYPELLPRTSVMITNGGYGGTQMALSYGVPLVVAGTTEDKPEVAARVEWSGAGINLRTATPTPDAIRRAVRAILDEPRYRERARALAGEYARHDAVASAVEAVERAAASPHSSRRVATVPSPSPRDAVTVTST